MYSVEDHKKHLDWIHAVNPKALLSVKVSTPNDVEMVAVGSYYAGANIVHLDGGYGGTGAAPEIAKKNIAQPIEYAIPKVHRFLEKEGIREDVTLICSGGMRTAMDIAKAICLGADGVVIGTAEMVAMGCVRCANCESGRGCPRGIATTDLELEVLNEIPIPGQEAGQPVPVLADAMEGAAAPPGHEGHNRAEGQDGPAPLQRNTREDAVMDSANKILQSRRKITKDPFKYLPQEAEGGCGVVGLAASKPVEGCHILQPLEQMHNRGNGKGGGISAVGLVPEQLGVDRQTLESHYLVQVAYLKDEVREQLEKEFIQERYDVRSSHVVPISNEPVLLARLEVRPPTVVRYFCRAKPARLDKFIVENELQEIARGQVEDEYVNQTSFEINQKFYANNAMQAFVMSQGRNMLIMKIVGYAEDVIRYYKMEDFKANIWIGHQRYPTKGRVWHPGGAHPFMGLDEALVHNGDFANYVSVTEYLGQKGIKPLFLTDTEVSVLLFDLLNRVYGYPLEYILEALAPTTERDFHQLSPEKQKIYRAIQSTHLHRSPDGPWFFIISRNDHYNDKLQLIGITDTSMLRPQVFALVEGEMQIGLIASEKQAIDSALLSLASYYKTLPLQADMYWNATGREPHRRRVVHLQPREGHPGQRAPADLQQQVRGARHGPGEGVRHGRGCHNGPPAAHGQEVGTGRQDALRYRGTRVPAVEARGPFIVRRGDHRHDILAVGAVRERGRVPEEDRPADHRARPPVPDRQAAQGPDNDAPDGRHRVDAAIGPPGGVEQIVASRAGGPEELSIAGRPERPEGDGHRLHRIPHGRGGGSIARHLPGRRTGLEEHHHLRDDRTEVLRLRAGPAHGRHQAGRLRKLRRLPGVRSGRGRGHHPRQRTGPAGADPGIGQVRHPWRRWADLHVRGQGRQRLHPRQRRRKAADQRRGQSRGWSSTGPAWTIWPSRSWRATR